MSQWTPINKPGEKIVFKRMVSAPDIHQALHKNTRVSDNTGMHKTAKNKAYEANNKNKSAAKAGAGEKHVDKTLLTTVPGGKISVESQCAKSTKGVGNIRVFNIPKDGFLSKFRGSGNRDKSDAPMLADVRATKAEDPGP